MTETDSRQQTDRHDGWRRLRPEEIEAITTGEPPPRTAQLSPEVLAEENARLARQATPQQADSYDDDDWQQLRHEAQDEEQPSPKPTPGRRA